jgi:AraC-like DNA-binding protein
MEALYLATSVLTVFFILILAGKKQKSRSDNVLLIWFFLLFTNALSFYLIIKAMAPGWLVDFLDHSVFLHGPLLYLYTSALTGIPMGRKVNVVFHLLPFFVLILLSAWLRSLDWLYLDTYINVLIVFKFILPLIYTLASLRMIRRHRLRLAHIFSSTNQMELRWLSGVLYGLLALIVFGAGTMLLHYFTPLTIPQYGGQYLNISYSVFIMVLGYFGFRQTAIFIPSHLRGDQALFSNPPRKGTGAKYQKSKLKEDFLEKKYKELLHYMENARPFIDKNLTLIKLAGQLDISENKLSQVINTKSPYNFFEFVNRYRVELVIQKMKSGEHKSTTLLGLAFDSGFNSKASFNRAFKKYTGHTPSDYLKTT